MACWLLDPDSKEPTLHSIVSSFLPHELPLLDGIETGQGIQSLGLNVNSEHSGRYRASVESILTFNAMNQLNSLLKKENLKGKNNLARIFMLLQTGDSSVFIYFLSQAFIALYHTSNANSVFGLSRTEVNKLSAKGQTLNSFDFAAQAVSIINIQLCHHSAKAAIDNMKMNVPIKL